MFWYDQSRDFFTVQSIFEDRDLKIQGPSASGTNDTLYHGVFYYYLILPAVLLGGGSPMFVGKYLAIIGSLAVFVIYFIAKVVFKSRKTAIVAALLLAFSFTQTHQSTWLSNPQILTLSVGFFYLFFWKVFFKKPRLIEFALLGLSLGLCIQGGLFDLFLVGALITAYFIKMNSKKKLLVFNTKQNLTFIFSFLLAISTMIFTQLLLIYRNVLTTKTSSVMGSHSADSISVLSDVIKSYLNNIFYVITPDSLLLFFVFAFLLIVVGLMSADKNQRIWIAILFSSPLWLLLSQYRNSPHIFIGFEFIIYILLAVGILHIQKSLYLGKTLSVSIILIFCLLNLSTIQTWKNHRNHLYGIQKGALLSEQLALIDKTYELSNGEGFSFSSSTNPYGINTTWSYLYNWYGKQKYGYLPNFVGDPQVGIFGENRIPESFEVSEKHFTILEPDTGLNSKTYKEFLKNQNDISSSPSATLEFGTLQLQIR